MTNYIILFLCTLIILAYLFDITSKYSKIPGVILLIALGILIQQIVSFTSLEVPNMKPYLPVLGTLGLILIVLEASLELKLERGKSGLIMKSVSAAIFLFVFFVAFLTLVMVTVFRIPPVSSLLTSIPLGVISSAVAISSAGNLMPSQKEFIVYESSLSDIIGILFFDFILIYGDSSDNHNTCHR